MQAILFVKSELVKPKAEVVIVNISAHGMMLLLLSHWTHSRAETSLVTTRQEASSDFG